MNIDYASVPVDYMAGAIERYVEHHIEPSGFMQALLCNDLREAVMRADGMNVAHIPHWVSWMVSNLPRESWGSPERYHAWLAGGSDAKE